MSTLSLAGSERQRQSGATGERLKEASGINVSLTVLGQVIMALVDAQHGRRRHVPYRNSRLTFLLQVCLVNWREWDNFSLHARHPATVSALSAVWFFMACFDGVMLSLRACMCHLLDGFGRHISTLCHAPSICEMIVTPSTQDSLGGNSKTMMIANISPASPNLADTHSTLRFAQRVKAIRNTVRGRRPSSGIT